jgi:hypothetical protein
MYAFSVLKALEAVLKLNLSKCGIEYKNKFDMFKKDSNKIHILEHQHNRDKVEPQDIEKLENLYNHLHNQRHTLFHFGIVIDSDTIVGTRTLNSKEEAKEIIEDTLKIINDNYIA